MRTLLLVFALSVPLAQASEFKSARYRPLVGTRGMVVSDDAQASEWGAEILRKGGNAVDAAVATAFALAVTRPHFGSLGGGGFMVYCPKPRDARPSDCQVIDYRESAPKAATRDMFMRDGKGDTKLSQDGALASGVPGVSAGLLLALERFGTKKRSELLAGPIAMARKGVLFTGYGEHGATERWKAMNGEAKKLLGCGGDKPCAPGTQIKQPDLAGVLDSISKEGRNGFYRGKVAKKIVDSIRKAGGVMTLEDLASYEPRVRKPVKGSFRGMEVVTMPPPSAGGTTMVQMLGFVELADKAGELAEGFGSARTIHALAHAMTLAFADRAEHFGDPDHYPVPIVKLISAEYVRERWKSFDPDHSLATETQPGHFAPEGSHTTHFSVIDREGNAVAITTTINDNFGSGFVPEGTGIFMNNEMDDFSIQPGVPNLFGLVGAEANAVAPGKRPLSSMSPTIVRDSQGNARLVVGAAGGPRITTSVFQVLVNRLHFGMTLPDAVAAHRFHHQWKPNELRVESFGFPEDTRAKLRERGHVIKEVPVMASVHAIERFPDGRVWGAPDIRGEGAAIAE